jgi:hypothetical protein
MTALCLLALAAVTPQDAMATPITMQYAAAPTKACVEQLAKSSGVKLTVDFDMGMEPIIVRVHERSLRKVMDAMADALGGVWVEADGGYKLSPDKDLEAQENATANARMTKGISDGLKETLSQAKTIDWNGPEGKEYLDKEIAKMAKIIEDIKASMNGQTPGASITVMSSGSADASPARDLLYKILGSMTPEQFNSIPWDEAVVFSTVPTRKQVRINANLAGPIKEFVTTHNTMAGAITKAKSTLPPGINVSTPALDIKPIEGGVQKVLVQVKRDENGTGFSVQMKVADREGRIVANAESGFTVPAQTFEEPKLDMGAAASELVEIAPVSKELASLLSRQVSPSNNIRNFAMSMGNGGPPAKVRMMGEDSESAVTEEARSLASRPDQTDPLSLAPGEMTAALADAMKVDLIAVLPDKAAIKVGDVINEGKVAFGRLPNYFKESEATAEVKDGVLIVEPRSHVDARWNRVNRSALANLTSDLYQKGFCRMMDAAHYASNGNARGELDRAYLKIFTDDWDDALFGMSSTRCLFRVLGHAWGDVDIRPQTVETIGMKAPLKHEVESLLYSAESMMMFGSGGGKSMMAIGISDGPGEGPERQGPMLADEPTERFQNGLPQEAKLNIAINPGRALFIKNRVSGRGMFCTVQELAMRMSSFVVDGGGQPTGPNYKSDDYSYAVSTMSDVQVGVEFPNVDPRVEFFKDGRLDTATPKVSYGQLPKDFADELKEIQEQMGQNRMGFGGPVGGKQPPPQP